MITQITPNNIELEVTPELLAKWFANMDSREQATFFNVLADEVAEWGAPFAFQMDAISAEKHLTNEARDIMKKIGEYSNAYE